MEGQSGASAKSKRDLKEGHGQNTHVFSVISMVRQRSMRSLIKPNSVLSPQETRPDLRVSLRGNGPYPKSETEVEVLTRPCLDLSAAWRRDLIKAKNGDTGCNEGLRMKGMWVRGPAAKFS